MRKVSLTSAAAAIAVAASVCACSSIDCTMNNLVYTNYALYGADGERDTLRDTLTVYTERNDGNDVVVINKDVNITSFILPISYSNEQDVFYLQTVDKDGNATVDKITVSKTDRPSFESLDCAPAFFHTITGVEYTQNKISQIEINVPEVNYDTTKEHFHIYFKHSD